MRFTAQEEYGLRCLLQLAHREGDGPLTIQDIADREALSPAYVGKLMRVLQKGELVTSERGPKGGYRIARPAEEMSLAQILFALDGPFYSKRFCERFTGTEQTCVHIGDCSIRSVWRSLEYLLESFLNRTCLKDLMRSEPQMNRWLEESIEDFQLRTRGSNPESLVEAQ